MEEKTGLVHIYCGDGKGKTTAAMGLALRAIGNGMSVVIVQFLKDGSSGEIAALSLIRGAQVTVFANNAVTGFSFNMDGEKKSACRAFHEELLQKGALMCKNGACDLLILDEVFGAVSGGVLSEKSVLDFLKNCPNSVEIVLTGRNPSAEILALGDYISEVKKVKHPFDSGISARKGIEK